MEKLSASFRLVRLHYDAKGRSAGSAEIEFMADSDAKRAVEKYEGVTLDGRPLRFEYLIPKPTSKRSKNVRKNIFFVFHKFFITITIPYFTQGMRSDLDPTGVYGKENAARAHRKENHVYRVGGGRKASPEGKQISPNQRRTSSGTTGSTPKERGASAGTGTWSDKKKPKREVSKEQLDEEMDAYMKNAR